MIPNIKKILYATDLSENSAYAFRYAINSALKHDAGIIILHVFELGSATKRSTLNLYLDEDVREKIFNENVSDTIDRIRRRLKAICDKEFNGDTKYAASAACLNVFDDRPPGLGSFLAATLAARS